MAMTQLSYENNKKLLEANKQLLEGLVSKTGNDPGNFIINMLKMVYDMGITAMKENTEYECRNSMLNRMTESVTKEG